MDRFPTAVDLAAAIRSRQVRAIDVVEEVLRRYDQLNPQLGAIVWRDDEQARRDARLVDQRLDRGDEVGPFAGVPVPIKDLTAAAGQPTTYGSRGARGVRADEDELVVAALRRAGFVLCGRTNTPELGPLPVTENLRYGVTRNPWNLDRSPGGSSGGAGAAVAAGMVPVAHANDGGGSIRIPASCCGLVGLKPSRWRVPSVAPGWLGLSVEGVLTRTIGDAAALLDVLSVPDLGVWEQAPAPQRPFAAEPGTDPGRLRIALLDRSALGIEVAASCRAAVSLAGTHLESLGHHVEWLDADVSDPAVLGPYLDLMHSSYGAVDDIDWAQAEPHVQVGRQAGAAVDGLRLVAGLRQLRQSSRRLVRRFGTDFDLLVTPTMAVEPPVAGEVLRAVHAAPEEPSPTVLAMAAFTVPWNVTGQPAISLPLGWSADGMPVGVQVVGRPWGEAQLLQVAGQLEVAAPWQDRHPPVR
jgi:amidase